MGQTEAGVVYGDGKSATRYHLVISVGTTGRRGARERGTRRVYPSCFSRVVGDRAYVPCSEGWYSRVRGFRGKR
jgi:hypothetical protein